MPSHIGYRVARYRDLAGMTQQQLADRIGRSREYVSMIENGRRAVTKRALLYDLAAALGVAIVDLTAQPYQPHDHEELDIYGSVVAMRQALNPPDEDEPLPPASTLLERAERVMAARMRCDYTTLAATLPTLVRQSRLAASSLAGHDREVALSALVRGTMTGALTYKIHGHVDLSARLADHAQRAAHALGDPVHQAAAEFASAQCVLSDGARAHSLRLATRAATQIQTQMTDDAARSWYLMLQLHAAISAASLHQPELAEMHLGEAAETGRRLASDPWHMEATATNVDIWRVGVALENGEHGRAPELAARVNLTQVRTSNRLMRLHLDAGRGRYQAGDSAGAVEAWLAADQAAPQELRSRPQVREIIGQMLRDTASPGAALRELALRCHVTA